MSSQTEEENKVVGDAETTALVQKRVYKEDGPYKDQELSSAAASFASAISAAYSIVSIANLLKTNASDDPVDKKKNYHLTKAEKKLLETRATEFAQPGIVPYDVLEDFLYVLCAIDSYETLKYVADVTKVAGLDNPSIVREPINILNVTDLSKIGYMANGLAALTRQIDSNRYPQAQSASDNTSSAYSALYKAASATDAAMQIINQFPGVDVFGGVLSQAVSLNSSIQGLVSSFSSDGSTQTKIASLVNVANQITSLKQSIANTVNTSGQQNVTSLFPMADKLTTFFKNAQPILNAANMMKNVTSSDSYPKEKVDDLNVQLKSINDGITKLQTNLTQVTSLLSSVKGPGNIGRAAGTMLNATSSYSPSQELTKETLGQAVPPHVVANNPNKMAASYIGRTFFGEGLIPAIDMTSDFIRKIGSFPTPAAGAGVTSFKMQNFASMGGSMSVQSMIMQLVYGVSSVAEGTPLASIINSQVADVVSVLGASVSSLVEPRRSDNAIPMMIGIARVLSNDSGCPFPSSVFSEGWKLASSVGNDLQYSRPDFLRHIQTSL